MVKPNKQTVGEGAMYISMQFVASFAAGYVFWIILSKITTTEIIGTFSVVVSLADIFANIGLFGLTQGIQRFLAKSLSEKKLYDARIFLKATIVLLSISVLTCIIAVLSASSLIYNVFRIDFTLLVVIVSVTACSSVYMLLNSIAIASYKTKVLPKIAIISSITKIPLAIILVIMGGGVIGLTIGYTLYAEILSCILLGIVIAPIFNLPDRSEEKKADLRHASKEIFVASIASWIPILVPTIGTDLAALVLFVSHGSHQAGVYFIALTISTAVATIAYSIFRIGLPVLSAMEDGRKRFTWHMIRLSAIVSLPISSSFVFYSKEIMQLIGQNYINGSLSLQVLLFSMLPAVVIGGMEALLYSSGSYRYYLMIGLFTNIPRTILYFILVPIYGSIGAAASYTIGSMIGFAISVVIARRIGMYIFWKSLASILVIPIGLAFMLHYFHVNFIMGIVITIIISLILFLEFRMLTISDLQDSMEMLPYNISGPIIRLAKMFVKK